MSAEIRENWTENQLKYIRFLGRGKKDVQGNRYSKAEFAKIIGVNPDTLYEWQKLPGFMAAVFEWSVSDNIDVLPDMLRAQVAKATGQELHFMDAKGQRKKANPGDTQAFLALMRQFGLLKSDKQEIKAEVDGTMTFNLVNYADHNNSV